jgi:hypothetical protein
MDCLQCIHDLNKLPDEVVSKIAVYLLSYGTPSARIMRDHIEESMRLLPQQSNDDNKTLWRYHVYSSLYNFISNVPSSKNGRYQQIVYYDIVHALLSSDDCIVRVQLSFRDEILKYSKLMASKLNTLRIFALEQNVYDYGTPSAIIMKQYVKDKMRKNVRDSFYGGL